MPPWQRITLWYLKGKLLGEGGGWVIFVNPPTTPTPSGGGDGLIPTSVFRAEGAGELVRNNPSTQLLQAPPTAVYLLLSQYPRIRVVCVFFGVICRAGHSRQLSQHRNKVLRKKKCCWLPCCYITRLSRCRCHDANLPTSGYVYLLMELSVSSY